MQRLTYVQQQLTPCDAQHPGLQVQTQQVTQFDAGEALGASILLQQQAICGRCCSLTCTAHPYASHMHSTRMCGGALTLQEGTECT